jgi:hypothetical protein
MIAGDGENMLPILPRSNTGTAELGNNLLHNTFPFKNETD